MTKKKHKCEKCGSKRKSSRHHVRGKNGLCGMRFKSDLPVNILIKWLLGKPNYIDTYFWQQKRIIWLCRLCHNDFHILLEILIKECDDIRSEEPVRKFIYG